MVQSLLRDEGYDVAASSSARDGMDRLSRFDPDVVLLDWQMPEITGIEMLTTIRDTPKYSDLYIIMLSGKIMTENIVKAITAGADDYVIKPFSPEELMARVFNGIRSGKRRSIGDQNRERIIKGLQKIESLSQQLSATKEKRTAATASEINQAAVELKDLLKSRIL